MNRCYLDERAEVLVKQVEVCVSATHMRDQHDVVTASQCLVEQAHGVTVGIDVGSFGD
jgi:hypothetical protein